MKSVRELLKNQYYINFALNASGQVINILLIFVIMPLIAKKQGGDHYGVFVLLHTTFLILLQFNHIYTSFLKLLHSKTGKKFTRNCFKLLFLCTAGLYAGGFLLHNLVFALAVVGSTLLSFIFRAWLISKNRNGWASFFTPMVNVVLLTLSLHGAESYDPMVFARYLAMAYIPINLWGAFCILRERFAPEIANKRKTYLRYVGLRTQQTLWFSTLTIVQSNLDKFIIPLIFDYRVLSFYQLLSMVPSRLTSLYGNIAFVVSKDIHEKRFDKVKAFFTYSAALLLFCVAILVFFHRPIMAHLIGENAADFYPHYLLLILVTFLQPFGFICFQIYSLSNKLFYYGNINLLSSVCFVALIFLFRLLGVDPLYGIIVSLMLSKFSEFLLAYQSRKITGSNMIAFWGGSYGWAMVAFALMGAISFFF